jgi:diadenosine tetraphosphate (Ap4A) HIT family hydrolase
VSDPCVFCEILGGRARASVVTEDDVAVCFMDIQPVNPGHVLIVPKEHAASLAELDEEVGAHLFKIALRIQNAIRRSGLRCEGVNVFAADGEAAGQDVFHVHLHVFPRFDGDAMTITYDWSRRPSHDELDEVAGAISRAYTPPSG